MTKKPTYEELEERVKALKKEVAALKRAEEKIQHLNLTLSTIRNVNQLINRERDRDKLVKGICDKLVETRGYYNAWIALLDKTGGLITSAEAGLGKDFLPMVELLKSGKLTDCGKRALSQAHLVITEEPVSKCPDCPLSAMYSDRGALTVRLEYDGKVYGLLCSSIPSHFASDEEEKDLFEEIASDISYALYSLEVEEKGKWAEEALRQNEEKYRTLFENASEAIYVTQDGKIKFPNPKMEELYGYSAEELTSKPFTYFIHQEDQEMVLERYKRRLRGEIPPSTYPFRIINKAGDTKWVEINAVAFSWDHRPATLCFLTDITERKRAEKALKESEERYRTLVQNIPVAVYRNTPGPKGRFLMANPTFLKMFGLDSEEEFKKITVTDLYMNPKDRKAFSDNILAKGSVDGVELLLKKKDGTPLWGSVTARAVYDETGKACSFDCMIMDITARKRAEDALNEERNLLRTIIDNVPDLIYIKDTKSRYLVSNSAFVRFRGATTQDEVLGKTPFELFPQELASKYYADDQEVIRSGQPLLNREERSVDETDKEMWVLTTKVPLRDSSGKIVGLVGIARDITEHRKIGEERARLIKELQKTNKELIKSSQELKKTTLQLVQSEKMSALGELTAGVAHELNQPLNGIKIISQSILRDMEKDRFEEDKLGEELTEIVHQVNKMAEIIDHMRVFTRKSEGMPEERIDLNTVIEGPFKLLNQQLKDHNIEVVTELAPALPRVMGDPIRLEQVFMNLITNARIAVDSGGEENKRIEIRTYKVGNRKEVAAEVKDNGGGIPEDLRDKIFQPFFTTTDPGKGTGLGLSVSAKIVEEHRGRIELDSEEGKGSTFRVILPIAG